jgi:hypothetical protein
MRNVRDYYIKALTDGISKAKASDPSVGSEICLETKRQCSHLVYRLFVADIVTKGTSGIGITEVNVDPIGAIDPAMNVDAPVAWNGIEFRCKASAFPNEAVSRWAEKWISDESPPCGPCDNLTGIIHSITEPETESGITHFSVDFGSAPLLALDELVSILGSGLVAVGSYSLSKA